MDATLAVTDWPGVLTAVSLVIVAITGLVTAVATARLRGAVGEVRKDVATTNGIRVGLLAERAEGRRIEADVPKAKRTESEHGYVERLHETTDAEGNPVPVDVEEAADHKAGKNPAAKKRTARGG